MTDAIIDLASGEIFVRDDEAVCPQTGYTYNVHLPKSPHPDERGLLAW